MSREILAAVLREHHAPFRFETVTLDDPRDDEVLVRMVASGVCGTDIGVQKAHIPYPLPGVLGHEGAGIVEEVGSAVTSVVPGDKVLLSFTSCGTCRNCRAGHPAYCFEFLPRNLLGGRRADGTSTIHQDGEPINAHFFAQSSFATHVLADERGVTKVDEEADLSLLAPLGCGIQTGAGAVLNILKPEPGATLAVMGAGAVGLAAVMAAQLTAVERVIVADLVDPRLELAGRLGATDVINTRGGGLAESLLELTGGEGVDYAIDATGNTGVLADAVNALAPHGTAAAIGAPSPGSTVDVDVNFLLNGRRLIGVTEGDAVSQRFLPALVHLIAEGRFPLEDLVTKFDFEQLNEAADGIAEGTVLKPVLQF